MKPAKDHSFRLLAARYMSKQARKLAKQLDGACRADDVEFVHQARVATRRLRAALRLFRDCFQRKQWKRWQKHIRGVTVGLGAARDRDVQIEYLCGILAGLAEQARVPGIARLLVHLEQQREELQSEVVEAVQRFQASGVLQGIRKVSDGIIKRNNGRHVSLGSPAAAKHTGKQIRQHLGALLSFQDCLDDPEDSEQHHAMRIAAKRLRYTVEISEPVYNGALAEHLKIIKRVQTFLGDIHDCDVWADDLRAFAKAEKRRIAGRFGDDGPYERLRPGIAHLAQARLQQRAAIFDQLVLFWRELEADHQWDRLREVLESGIAAGAGGGLPAPAAPRAGKPPAPPAPPDRRRAESVPPPNGNGTSAPKRQPEPVAS